MIGNELVKYCFFLYKVSSSAISHQGGILPVQYLDIALIMQCFGRLIEHSNHIRSNMI